jgi:hypothetical protein
MSRKLRGLVAGMALAAVTMGAVSLATPGQAAEIGIFVRDHRPAARYEPVPPPPHARYVRWEQGRWAWTGHRWVWASGHYIVRRGAPPAYDHHHWNYYR